MKVTERICFVGSGAVGLTSEGDCHTYLICGDNALALVDCGKDPDPQRILDVVRSDGFDVSMLRYCFLTHAHFDHAGGCQALRRRGVQIIASMRAREVLRKGPVQVYGLSGDEPWIDCWRQMPVSDVDIPIATGDTFDLGGIKVQAIETPGHSPDSVCYLATDAHGRRDLFSGDTVFYKGFISMIAPVFSDIRRYPDSVHALAELNINGLFPGHLMWVLEGGQAHIDVADRAFQTFHLPKNKPFS